VCQRDELDFFPVFARREYFQSRQKATRGYVSSPGSPEFLGKEKKALGMRESEMTV